MLNAFVLVGFVKEKPFLIDAEKSQKWMMKVETDRPYREADGTCCPDVFMINIWKGIAEEIVCACVPGTCVAVKGRLYSDVSKNHYEMIAEYISFPGRQRIKENFI